MALGAGFLTLGASLPAAAQIASNDILDFMIMDVCVDAADHILPGVTPYDAACSKRRNIRAGEKIPYHLHDFPAKNAGCAGRLGAISKDNIPIERDGVTRVVSFYDKGVDHSCPDVAPNAPRFGELESAGEGGSVQWADDGYGFIMGSWSPVALSSWRTPLCQENPNSSRRFARAWVIGPAKLPPRGVAGVGVFAAKHESGDPAATAGSCPRAYGRSANVWVRDEVAFKSGHTLEALVSDHFSKDVTSPRGADAMQIERTYWTKEFGLSRWEKWARADWVHPRSGKSAMDLAQTLYASGMCSDPYMRKRAPSPKLTIGPAEGAPAGVYAQTVTVGGQSHQWVMTLCRDYTNVVVDENGGLEPKWGEAISPAYWAR
ncbi:hypothetical protein [Methylocella sp.]|uniref:hypothetical protein n=1 Tax=Methylocella sp. TaxID=1978226 RepID=UPI0035B3ED64